MSDTTKIQWCDSTWNEWEGCTKVSPGCANCYAEKRDNHWHKGTHWGKGAPRLPHLKTARKKAMEWNRKPWVCDDCGKVNDGRGCKDCHAFTYHRRRVFVNSLSDWLDPEVPVEWLASMLDTIRQCPELTWILCTKRPELWPDRINEARYQIGECSAASETWIDQWRDGFPPPNIILLASVENQEMAYKRKQELLRIPAACHGLSVEPMLERISLDLRMSRVSWVIVGGESGPKARPCNIEWIRSVKDQCKAASVPCFVKQLGSNPRRHRSERPNSMETYSMRDAGQITHPKGGDPAEWPEDLRVREFPTL